MAEKYKSKFTGYQIDAILDKAAKLSRERVKVGTVTTAPSGSQATVETVYNENDTILNFTIPKGDSPQRGTDYWTDADKSEIKGYIDENTKLGDWEDIATVTTDAAVSAVTVDKDSNGNAFNLSDAIIQFQIPIESPPKTRSVYFGKSQDPTESFSRVNITSSTNSIMLVTAYERIVSGRIICIGGLGSTPGYQNSQLYAIENGYARLTADSISAVCAFTYNDAFPAGSKLIIRGIRKK